jgi:MYXO-CTERM domain-containing protein
MALIGWLVSSAHAELVGHYPFDTGFEDVSGLGNNGTAEGGASLAADVPAGMGGQSLSLADGQYVLVPHSDSLSVTETMTVAAWIKTMGVAWEGLLAKSPSDGSSSNHAGNYEIRIENGSNQLNFLYQRGAVDDTAFPFSDTPQAVITPDTWTHVAVTVEQIGDQPGEVKYYTNGLLADTKPTEVGFGATNTNPLYIGTRADLFTQFNGNIDDLRIYNTVLSDAEIMSLVPEPSGAMLSILALAGLGVVRRRRGCLVG